MQSSTPSLELEKNNNGDFATECSGGGWECPGSQGCYFRDKGEVTARLLDIDLPAIKAVQLVLVLGLGVESLAVYAFARSGLSIGLHPHLQKLQQHLGRIL